METNTPITIQRAITPKLLRFRISGLVLFERAQNSEQDECIFMQLNSNSSPGATIEIRNLKKLFLVKIKKKETNKGLRRK